MIVLVPMTEKDIVLHDSDYKQMDTIKLCKRVNRTKGSKRAMKEIARKEALKSINSSRMKQKIAKAIRRNKSKYKNLIIS